MPRLPFLFLAFTLFLPGTCPAKDLPKIAVWDLEARDVKATYAKELTSILVSEIAKLKKYEVFSQDDVRTLAGWTAERMKLGCSDTTCLTALGQMDVFKLISGSVGKIGNRYSASVKLFDTRNARAENSISEFCWSEDELIELVQVATRKLLGEEMPPPSAQAKAVPPPPVPPSSTLFPARPAGPQTAPAERAGINKAIDSVTVWNNGKAYFFKGRSYLRYDINGDRADPDYPQPIDSRTWPGVWTEGIDAAVNWGNGKAYFFKGGEFIRYDLKADRADPGYPKRIDRETWPGMIWTDGIDAVTVWDNGKAYFFKGRNYIRYDIKKDLADPGYPQRIDNKTWPEVWAEGIDTVGNWGNGKAYFFKGKEYIRYDTKADKADPEYPKPVNDQTWPGLVPLLERGPYLRK